MLRYLALLLVVFLATPAEARHRHSHHRHHARVAQLRCGFFDPRPACQRAFTTEWQAPIKRPAPRHVHVARHHVNVHVADTQMLPHPAGCPARAFCACGAAVEKFGRPIRNLWLAANWYRFPRSSPISGAVAVRPHHVFVLRQHVDGDLWLVADYNSGGHLSRLHVRSISGYTIVNPS